MAKIYKRGPVLKLWEVEKAFTTSRTIINAETKIEYLVEAIQVTKEDGMRNSWVVKIQILSLTTRRPSTKYFYHPNGLIGFRMGKIRKETYE